MIELIELSDEKERQYYDELNVKISFLPIWRTLQSKTDYGNNVSELPYQLSAKTLASRLARIVGANDDKAEALTALAGCYFPINGDKGKKVLQEYLIDKGINMSNADLARTVVETSLDEGRIPVSKQLDQELKEIFDKNSFQASCPEVEIARLCQDTVMKVKTIERFSGLEEKGLMYKINKDIIEQTEKKGKLSSSIKLDELYNYTMSKVKNISLPEEKVSKMINGIESMSSNPLTAVCLYSTLPDHER